MNRERNSKFDLLAVLLLLCVFSVAILSLLLTGAKSYRGLTQSGKAVQDSQTAALYLSNRIFQAESKDSLDTESHGSVQCLCIYEQAGGQCYVTRVYCYDGWIRELYSAADVDFDPKAGEKVIKAQALSFSKEPADQGLAYLIWAELTTEEGTQKLPFAWKGAYIGYEK